MVFLIIAQEPSLLLFSFFYGCQTLQRQYDLAQGPLWAYVKYDEAHFLVLGPLLSGFIFNQHLGFRDHIQ